MCEDEQLSVTLRNPMYYNSWQPIWNIARFNIWYNWHMRTACCTCPQHRQVLQHVWSNTEAPFVIIAPSKQQLNMKEAFTTNKVKATHIDSILSYHHMYQEVHHRSSSHTQYITLHYVNRGSFQPVQTQMQLSKSKTSSNILMMSTASSFWWSAWCTTRGQGFSGPSRGQNAQPWSCTHHWRSM